MGTFLEAVHLAVANIIIIIGQGLLAHADFSPAGAGILLAVEGQGRGQRKRQRFARRARVQLGVHIECESDGGIVGSAGQTRNAIVLLSVDAGDCEGIFKEKRVRHGCDHRDFRLCEWSGENCARVVTHGNS